MSEAELYLIRQRMAPGLLAKAERGELAVQLPIGYVRRPSGEVVLEPDEQARSVVMAVFDAFDRLGTLNAVLPGSQSITTRLRVLNNRGSDGFHRPRC
jgi:DNA invertase Pin-like site-specific DNA recombinase